MQCSVSDWCIWNVCWSYKGYRYVVDYDDVDAANRQVRDLTEAGRIDVVLAGPQIMQIDRALEERLRNKILAHINGEDGETVARLRLELRERTESAEMANQLAAAYREGNR